MIDLEPNMSTKDVCQWLREGYFWYLPQDGSTSYRIGALVHYKESPDDVWIIRDIESGHDVSFPQSDMYGTLFPHWPKLGSINIADIKCGIHLSRIQMKQWKRTYNFRQIRVTVPRKWELNKRPDLNLFMLSANTPSVVQGAFRSVYPINMEEAKQWFRNGWNSIALTSRIIVTNTEPKLVYYKGVLAARLIDGQYDCVDPVLTMRIEKTYPGGMDL